VRTHKGVLNLLTFNCKVTILLCSSAPGLEVLSPEGHWTSAPAVPGSLIVNVADFLMRWTNGVYKSTVHRVINRTSEARYSVPLFFSINYDQVVEVSISVQKKSIYTLTTTDSSYMCFRYKSIKVSSNQSGGIHFAKARFNAAEWRQLLKDVESLHDDASCITLNHSSMIILHLHFRILLEHNFSVPSSCPGVLRIHV
jgi:hypothetical protein